MISTLNIKNLQARFQVAVSLLLLYGLYESTTGQSRSAPMTHVVGRNRFKRHSFGSTLGPLQNNLYFLKILL
jgi:hypothetical protein